ncbi:MAG: hypothetical protein HKM28_04635 [Flavobacteriaceae bacterium]|nr:hypothetical protein [Flavobacteriaceae bacterium]
MFPKTNIHHRLEAFRNKRTPTDTIIQQVMSVLNENEEERETIRQGLQKRSASETNTFDLDLLEREHIYHISDIEKLCITYRLRFLPASFFKGDIPEEAISKIRSLEKNHETKLNNLHIIAPARLLKLENADDPLLLAPMVNDYYYSIHKWGTDLHPLRKILMWPFKTFENIILTVLMISLLLTWMAPVHLLAKTHGMQEYVLLFLFIFKGVAGMVLFYGFAKGKNFNNAIWKSKYYNA